MPERNKLADQLRIILDVPSLKSKKSQIIQSYGNNDLFEFIAIGEPSTFIQLQTDFANEVIWITKGNHEGRPLNEQYAFPYTEEIIANIATALDLKLDEVKLFCITRILTAQPNTNQKVILITERKKLVNYQKYFHDKLKSTKTLLIEVIHKKTGKSIKMVILERFKKYL